MLNSRSVACFIAGFALLPLRAIACFCLPSPSTACEDNLRTEIVFVGRVKRVRLVDKGTVREVRLTIRESFRGVTDQEVDLITSTSDCGIDFLANKNYLVYAWRDQNSGRLKTGACSRTALVEESAENIENLRAITSGRGVSRVFGFATSNPSDLQIPVRPSLPIAGIPIVVRSGSVSWRTVTNDRGEYEITNLPAGKYEASAALPKTNEDQRTHWFELVAGGCSRQNFLGVPVARISGRLLDASNQPVPNVLVEVEAVPLRRTPSFAL